MSTPSSRARTRNILALILHLLAPSPALAQGVDPQRALTAQALYEQATAEMNAKHYASACRKLEEVTRLVPEGIGARLTLGRCYEAQGRLASAWSQFALAQSMSAKVGQEERTQFAAEKAAALKPLLATLTIEVPDALSAIAGLSIVRDGIPLGEPQWGTPIPVDAGGHSIVVTAPDYNPWKKQIEVVSDGARVLVKVPPLEPKSRLADKPAPSIAPPIVLAMPERTWQRPAGVAAMVFGGVGVGAGAVLGALAIAKNAESKHDNHCDAINRCDDVGLAQRSEAVGLGNGSTAAFIIGAATLAGGVVLFVTAPHVDSGNGGKRAARAQVSITPGGAVVKGAW